MTFWSTVKLYADLPGSEYVNWNALFYKPVEWKRKRRDTLEDVLYYGSFRSDGGQRLKTFDKYFWDPSYHVTISSSSKQFNRYECERVDLIPPLTEDFPACLSKHGLGLYIEDDKSHVEFHSPATRFYEMLSAGLPMAFQEESIEMLSLAGINVEPWIVDSQEGVQYALKNSEDYRKEQHEELAQVDHAKKVKKQVRKLLEEL